MKRHHFFAVNGLFAVTAGLVGLSGIITTFDVIARTPQTRDTSPPTEMELPFVRVNPSETASSVVSADFVAFNFIAELNSFPPQEFTAADLFGLKVSIASNEPIFGPKTCLIKIVHADSGKIIGQTCVDFESTGNQIILFDEPLLLKEEYPQLFQIQINTGQIGPDTIVTVTNVAPIADSPFNYL